MLTEPSAIGLFAAAALDPEYFTGLPFTEEDALQITQFAHRRHEDHSKYAPRPLWNYGEIVAHWHTQDDLVSDEVLTAEGLRTLL